MNVAHFLQHKKQSIKIDQSNYQNKTKMYYSKVLPLLFLLAFSYVSLAQNQQIKKADKLYKLNEYSDAISLYEAGLREEENLSAKTKLAYCYKMTNNLSNAEQLYSEIVYEERSRPITKYYYGETLMSNGKYDEAKNWFLKYAEQNPNDERAQQMVKACEKVSGLKPMFENVEVNTFSQNSRSDDSGPVFYKNGIVFTSDRKSGVNPLKQKSGWTGRDFLRIYYSEADSTGKYQKPQEFSKKLNEINKHCGPLSFNEQQNFVVFTRTGTKPGKNDQYNMQLYYSESSNGEKWKKPKLIDFCKKDHNYMHPALSPDGKTLYFVSDKPGGEGGTDIYKSKMTEKGWGTPLNLGAEVNTSFNEGFPFVGPDNKFYFCSKGHAGYGGFDVFAVEQNDKGLWSSPRNLGAPVNSSHDDISFHLNNELTKGVFASSRDGKNDNIYIFDIKESTVINSEMIEKEEVSYVRKPLKPTNVDAAVAGSQMVEKEEVVGNQLKSENNESESIEMNNVNEEEIVIEGMQSNGSEIIVESENQGTQNIDDSNDLDSNNNESEIVSNEAQNTGTEIIENDPVVDNKEEIVNDPSANEIQERDEPVGPAVAENAKENTEQTEKVNKNESSLTESNPVKRINIGPSSNGSEVNSLTLEELFKNRPMPSVFPFVQMKYLIKKGVDVKGKTFRVNGVQFEKGKYVITPEIALKLNLLVEILEQNPEFEVEIAAHTSSVGDETENLEISKARAGAIAAHLVNRGISSERLNAEGYGEYRLLNKCKNDVNCSEKQHNVNERVEIAIF